MSFLELLAADLPETLTEADYARYCCPAQLSRMADRPEADRRASCVGQLLLGALLDWHGYPSVEPPALGYGKAGKPFLTDHPELHFSISHSGGWVVCALSDLEIGVDLQEERPMRTSLVRKFHPNEQEMLKTLPESAFFDLWALKEALCKCTGEGLLRPLRNSVFTLNPVTVDQSGYAATLVDLLEPKLHLAVCAQCDSLPPIKLNILTR